MFLMLNFAGKLAQRRRPAAATSRPRRPFKKVGITIWSLWTIITVLIMFFFLRPAVSFFRPRNQSVSKRTKNQHHPATISPAALRNNSMQSYLKSVPYKSQFSVDLFLAAFERSPCLSFFAKSLHRSKDFREVHFYFEIIREIHNIYAVFQFNLRN